MIFLNLSVPSVFQETFLQKVFLWKVRAIPPQLSAVQCEHGHLPRNDGAESHHWIIHFFSKKAVKPQSSPAFQLAKERKIHYWSFILKVLSLFPKEVTLTLQADSRYLYLSMIQKGFQSTPLRAKGQEILLHKFPWMLDLVPETRLLVPFIYRWRSLEKELRDHTGLTILREKEDIHRENSTRKEEKWTHPIVLKHLLWGSPNEQENETNSRKHIFFQSWCHQASIKHGLLTWYLSLLPSQTTI